MNSLTNLRAKMQEWQVDGVIISQPENRHYLSGFTGSSGLYVVSNTESCLFTDFRYMEQASLQVKQGQVKQHGSDMFESACQWLQEQGVVMPALEGDHITIRQYAKLQQYWPKASWRAVNTNDLRMEKDEEELTQIREAVRIADEAFAHVIAWLKPGATELDLAVELEYWMRKLGSEKPAFDTIALSGARTSLPHGKPSKKVIEKGDLVLLDFGAVYNGYHSDMTRTFCAGPCSDELKKIYHIVQKAQLLGLNTVKSGRTGVEIDQQVRRFIAEAGYGECFGHGLGHGVGLAIHEEPRLSPTGLATLTPNMVVSVEPGIYVPGLGGVRIEDLVVVTTEGCSILTSSSKELIELDW